MVCFFPPKFIEELMIMENYIFIIFCIIINKMMHCPFTV